MTFVLERTVSAASAACEELTLSNAEDRAIQEMCVDIAKESRSSDAPATLVSVARMKHEMPLRIRVGLEKFRLEERSGYLHVRGHRVDQSGIGRTPETWRNRSVRSVAELTEEIRLLLFGSLLGDPFGWKTQQDGRLIHEVFPIFEDQNAQLGTGSLVKLTWHTEDAFHPCRADYIGLLAVRNPDSVPTTVGVPDVSRLDAGTLEVLFAERFVIKPDESHLRRNNSCENTGTDSAFEEIERQVTAPQLIAALWGSRDDPYIRLDPYFMETLPGDIDAQRALDALAALTDESLVDVSLDAGGIVLIDNGRAVHGRPAFPARFDGNDRWLKRVNITRDLRKSRRTRGSIQCRTVG
jgi:Fe(II)/alpha-ketoglutarate-dependent arginine beta-hydroxylase